LRSFSCSDQALDELGGEAYVHRRRNTRNSSDRLFDCFFDTSSVSRISGGPGSSDDNSALARAGITYCIAHSPIADESW
jgi:hypothetical protein